ncbi:nuclear transport factor 2 family protein [Microlunatus speluncae]|uniref:nuclear transport factor 2 family protein n=1 Tax=Microlunatus speluncae TaxID=2594267 RepID=UPI0012666C1E|nr:nuclear transport factor 2 family protein [Microlunatus speluncae]
MTATAEIARRFLETLEARDWAAWEGLLAEAVVYELPQSRERIRGRSAYRRFNETYPGEWHLTPKVIIGDEHRAVVWFAWTLSDGGGEDDGDAQAFFEFDDAGLISKVTDFWPEPYEPPARPDGLVERW